ncbi:MAG: DnaD domain protein [Bacilli bacterium]|nr:DnaD domain protein [Bacilli bacterium]
MGDTIVKLYQKQNFVIGEDILRTIKKNGLTLNEALLIIYFCGNNNHPILDIEEIQAKFMMSELEIMQAFASITDKSLIKIKMVKNKDGKVEELIDLTPFYESIAYDIDIEKKKENDTSVFSLFENEFGRPLSSMEFELINNWLDRGISEELINSALKEAIFNGSFTLRYIDAILTEWVKKGFKTHKDVDLYLKKRKAPKVRKNEDLFDYNWLDDEE